MSVGTASLGAPPPPVAVLGITIPASNLAPDLLVKFPARATPDSADLVNWATRGAAGHLITASGDRHHEPASSVRVSAPRKISEHSKMAFGQSLESDFSAPLETVAFICRGAVNPRNVRHGDDPRPLGEDRACPTWRT